MVDNFSLAGKTIVVTGGTGILGEAFINGIVEAGGAVGILGRNADVAYRRADQINRNGGRAIALVADVLDEKQLLEARDQVLQTFGKIDGLVNAAGGNMPDGILMPNQDIFKINLEGMKRVMDLNLWGTVIPTQIFGEAMAQTAALGSIVNISSMKSKRAVTRVLGDNIAKAAKDCYNQSIAVELATR